MNRFQCGSGRAELGKHVATTIAATIPSEFDEVGMQELFEAFAVLPGLEAMQLDLETAQLPKQIALPAHVHVMRPRLD